MKKLLRLTCTFLCTLLFCCCIVPNTAKAADSDTVTVEIEVQYGQTEARKMLDQINQFRTSKDEAWAYDKNGQKVFYSDLEELKYDYQLEKAAMLRAAEIALSFSHDRPNGSSCFTAYGGFYNHKGENIAAGHKTSSDVFTAWQETKEDYNGQGHRRNMLSRDFTSVGIGHVIYNGSHYWVQEFGAPANSDSAEETANDNTDKVSIEVLSSNLSNLALYTDKSSISIKAGAEALLPEAVLAVNIKDHFPANSCPLSSYQNEAAGSLSWKSADESIASVTADGKVKGIAAGKTTLTAAWKDLTASCEVTVRASGGNSSGSGSLGSNEVNTNQEYTITFNAAEGIIRGTNILTTTNQKIPILPTASKDGYIFKGWYTLPSGGNEVTTATVFSSDTVVYAHWELPESDYRDFSFQELTDTSASLIVTIPERYVASWGFSISTSSSSMPQPRVTTYNQKTTAFIIPITDLKPDTTYYYSVYYVTDTGKIDSGIKSFTTKKAVEYTVTFHPNGGTISGQSSMTTENKRLTTLPAANRTGYTFDGWYTSASGGVRVATTDVYDADKTVYAHWTAVPSITVPDTPSEPDTPDEPVLPQPSTGSEEEPASSQKPVTVKKVTLNSVKAASKTKIKVKWKKTSSVSGYQIVYSANKKFTSKKVKSAGKSTTTKTITGLKKGKTYYVKIRAYKTSGGKKYYGSWSSVKKVKTKK